MNFSFMFPLPIAQIMWSANGRCCNHLFGSKVFNNTLTALYIIFFHKDDPHCCCEHYISQFHCCSILVAYLMSSHFYAFGSIVEKSLLRLPWSMILDITAYMKYHLLCPNIGSLIFAKVMKNLTKINSWVMPRNWANYLYNMCSWIISFFCR